MFENQMRESKNVFYLQRAKKKKKSESIIRVLPVERPLSQTHLSRSSEQGDWAAWPPAKGLGTRFFYTKNIGASCNGWEKDVFFFSTCPLSWNQGVSVKWPLWSRTGPAWPGVHLWNGVGWIGRKVYLGPQGCVKEQVSSPFFSQFRGSVGLPAHQDPRHLTKWVAGRYCHFVGVQNSYQSAMCSRPNLVYERHFWESVTWCQGLDTPRLWHCPIWYNKEPSTWNYVLFCH